jgi:large subunit ribosomal protein L9e
MVTGVTQGFKYRMRTAAAHFPINLFVTSDKKTLEIKNFIGEKIVRKIQAKEGVTIVKDEKEAS